MPTVSKEDYLKAIYSLYSGAGGAVSTSAIAEALGVSKAATSEMGQKLSQIGLVEYEKYKGMLLTNEGRKIALQILRRHRLWELFLVKVLDLDWDKVHSEAETLEHAASDFLVDKIDDYLKHPKFDPHGAPIPDKNGKLPAEPENFLLTEGKKGHTYRVFRVRDEDNELLSYLSKLGIELDKKISVVDILPFDNSVIISIDSVNHSLSEKLASCLYVVNG